jgi:hypothetical protein
LLISPAICLVIDSIIDLKFPGFVYVPYSKTTMCSNPGVYALYVVVLVPLY